MNTEPKATVNDGALPKENAAVNPTTKPERIIPIDVSKVSHHRIVANDVTTTVLSLNVELLAGGPALDRSEGREDVGEGRVAIPPAVQTSNVNVVLERADAVDVGRLESAIRAELVPVLRRVRPTRIGFDPREGSRRQGSLAADEGRERREDRGEVATAPADSLHPLAGTSAELGEEVGRRGVVGGVDPHTGMRHFDEVLVHDASPSAGGVAEPGLVSTVSVGAEQGARGSNEEGPEEPITTALRDHRTDIFSVEVPVPEDTPRLVRRVERSDGREVYFGVALDLTDDIAQGRYRAALTPAEARELHAALGEALAAALPQS